MLSRMLRNFLAAPDAAGPLPAADARVAVAAVLVIAARADGQYGDDERAVIDRALGARYSLAPAAAAALRADGEEAEREAVDLFRFTRAIKLGVPHEERVGIVEALWRVVLADGRRDDHEDALMRQLVDLLGLTPMESALARQRVLADPD
jgi:uncharacterized tellurite resistance protein B-like protein